MQRDGQPLSGASIGTAGDLTGTSAGRNPRAAELLPSIIKT